MKKKTINKRKNEIDRLNYRKTTLDSEQGVPKSLDEDERSVEVIAATENPVEVFDYERYEVVREVLLMSGCEMPKNRQIILCDTHRRYDTSTVIGSFRGMKIEGDRLTGRSFFSAAPEGDGPFTKVKEGHLTDFSIGYRTFKAVWIPEDETATIKGQKFEGPLKVATRWKPTELSVVPIGADELSKARAEALDSELKTKPKPKTIEGRKHTMDEQTRNHLISLGLDPDATDAEAHTFMRSLAVKKPVAEPKIDVKDVEKRAIDRINGILGMAKDHGFEDQARQFIDDNKTEDEFRSFVLDELKKKNIKPVETADADIGLTEKETRSFSIMRAVRALANPGNPGLAEAAKFEFECSRAVEKVTHKEASGVFIPNEVQRQIDPRMQALNKRTLNVGSGASGGYLVDDVLAAGSFIEKLENSMVVASLGAIQLRDLVGDISIPKQTGGATSYWVGEGDDVTASTPALGQVRLVPKTVGAFTDMTRKFVLQSSISAEMFARNDLALRLALEIDRAAINGSGSANQPLGILNTTGIGSVTFTTANTPTWAEVVGLETAIAVDNALVGSLAYITAATINGNMKVTDKSTSTAQFILDKGMSNGYPVVMTNQVPAKHMIFGNWRDLIMAYWGNLDINVDKTTLGTSGGVRVIVLQDCDMAVRHAESFADGYKA